MLLLAIALSSAAAAAAQEPSSAGNGADVPISAGNVSKGLQVKDPLRIPPPPPDPNPTFRIEVQGARHLETALDAARRELAQHEPLPDQQLPVAPGEFRHGGGTDILPAIMGVVHGIQRARYERAERRIHEDVSEEIAAFCDVNDCSQVNEGLILPDIR